MKEEDGRRGRQRDDQEEQGHWLVREDAGGRYTDALLSREGGGITRW